MKKAQCHTSLLSAIHLTDCAYRTK